MFSRNVRNPAAFRAYQKRLLEKERIGEHELGNISEVMPVEDGT
jgi:hypothetical protein